MNTEHTPTPWTYREAFENGEPCGYVVQHGVNAIADVPQGESDAKFICKAVNSHYLLVSALEDVASGCTVPKERLKALLAKVAKGEA